MSDQDMTLNDLMVRLQLWIFDILFMTLKNDGEAPVKLGLWGMLINPSWPLLPGPHCLGEVAPDWDLSMDQREQTVGRKLAEHKLWLL